MTEQSLGRETGGERGEQYGWEFVFHTGSGRRVLQICYLFRNYYFLGFLFFLFRFFISWKSLAKSARKMSACSCVLRENQVLVKVCQHISGGELPPGGRFGKSLVCPRRPKVFQHSRLMIFHERSSGKRTLENNCLLYNVYSHII